MSRDLISARDKMMEAEDKAAIAARKKRNINFENLIHDALEVLFRPPVGAIFRLFNYLPWIDW